MSLNESAQKQSGKWYSGLKTHSAVKQMRPHQRETHICCPDQKCEVDRKYFYEEKKHNLSTVGQATHSFISFTDCPPTVFQHLLLDVIAVLLPVLLQQLCYSDADQRVKLQGSASTCPISLI